MYFSEFNQFILWALPGNLLRKAKYVNKQQESLRNNSSVHSHMCAVRVPLCKVAYSIQNAVQATSYSVCFKDNTKRTQCIVVCML